MGFLMALRVNTFQSRQNVVKILQTVHKWRTISLLTFDAVCLFSPIFILRAGPPRRSLHVLVSWFVFVIPVVVKIWAVVGCCHQGQRPFGFLWIERLLFDVDRMPGETREGPLRGLPNPEHFGQCQSHTLATSHRYQCKLKLRLNTTENSVSQWQDPHSQWSRGRMWLAAPMLGRAASYTSVCTPITLGLCERQPVTQRVWGVA